MKHDRTDLILNLARELGGLSIIKKSGGMKFGGKIKKTESEIITLDIMHRFVKGVIGGKKYQSSRSSRGMLIQGEDEFSKEHYHYYYKLIRHFLNAFVSQFNNYRLVDGENMETINIQALGLTLHNIIKIYGADMDMIQLAGIELGSLDWSSDADHWLLSKAYEQEDGVIKKKGGGADRKRKLATYFCGLIGISDNS